MARERERERAYETVRLPRLGGDCVGPARVRARKSEAVARRRRKERGEEVNKLTQLKAIDTHE